LFALFLRVADHLAQALHVHRRMLGNKGFQRLGVGQQLLAQAFNAVQPSVVDIRAARDRIQIGLDGFRVDLAHQLADQLFLAGDRAVSGQALGFDEGFVQFFGQVERGQLLLVDGHQTFAQFLQRRHVALHFGFADVDDFVVFLIVRLLVHGYGVLGQRRYDSKPVPAAPD